MKSSIPLAWVAAATLGPLAFTSVPARAQSTPEEMVLAESLFREGRRLFDEGSYKEACPKLAESQRLDPGGGTLLNLARCHAAEGRLATAWAEYQEARVWARRDGRTDRRAVAEAGLRSIEPRLTWLTIAIPPASYVPGIAIRIDERVLPSSAVEVPTPMDPGIHRVAVAAPGKQPRELIVHLIAEGEKQIIVIEPLSDAAPSPSVPSVAAQSSTAHTGRPKVPLGHPVGARMSEAGLPAQARPNHFRPSAPTVVLGVSGIVLLGAGSAFGILALDQMAKSDHRCPSGVCTDRGAEYSHQANLSANLANIGIGVGLGSIGAAVLIHALSKPKPDALSVSPRSWELTVHAESHAGWVGVRGRY